VAGLPFLARGGDAAAKGGAGMLRRLIAWCLPNRTAEPGETGLEMTDVARALAPYRDEPARPILRLADPIPD